MCETIIYKVIMLFARGILGSELDRYPSYISEEESSFASKFCHMRSKQQSPLDLHASDSDIPIFTLQA